MAPLLRNFAILATALTALVSAYPSSLVGRSDPQADAAALRAFEKRAPLAVFDKLVAERADSGELPIVPYNKLDASSDLPGGQNYTGYKNPLPGTFVAHPKYAAFSAFDFHSLNLGTHQELIELDLFNYMIARFSVDEFKAAGLDEEDIQLLRFFAQQEIGHAEVLSNLLGPKAPKMCQYEYPFNTVREALLFSEELTRWGESGVYGFLPSLDNRANAQILLQSIATEARQQFAFRQFLGVFPVPVWFETGVPQAYAWTLLSKYIKSCPSHNVPVGFSIFPELTIVNQPDLAAAGKAAGGAAISRNVSAISYPGRKVELRWEAPGKTQGPYGQKTEIAADDKTPRYLAWINQYNVTYSALEDVKKSGDHYTAHTKQPGGSVLPDSGAQGTINGTVFTAITNSNTFYTPLNLTLINGATIAGPALYQSG